MPERDVCDRARQALEGITDGPWMAGGVNSDYPFWVDTKPDLVCIPIAEEIENRADAEFIADAPELVRELVAELEATRAALGESVGRECGALCSDVERDRDELRAEVERLRANQRVEIVESWHGIAKGSS